GTNRARVRGAHNLKVANSKPEGLQRRTVADCAEVVPRSLACARDDWRSVATQNLVKSKIAAGRALPCAWREHNLKGGVIGNERSVNYKFFSACPVKDFLERATCSGVP